MTALSDFELSDQNLKQLGQIIDQSSYEIYLFEVEKLSLVYVNDSAKRNLCFTLDALKSKGVNRHIFCGGKSFSDHLLDFQGTNQAPLSFETLNCREDNSYYPLKVDVYSGYYRDKPAYIAIADDISQVKQAAAEVEAILDSTIEGVITIDEQGKILIFNKAAGKIFGYAPNEVLGKNVTMLMPSPYKENHDQYLKKYYCTGEKKFIGTDREVIGCRSSGEVFPMELSVAEVKFHGQRRFRFTGIIRDISERKAAEHAIKEREKELKQIRSQLAHIDRLHLVDEMTAGMAHELNQPLAAIANYANAAKRLAESVADEETIISNTLSKITQQALRAGQVVTRLRAMTSKREIEHCKVKPSVLLNDVAELIAPDPRLDHVTFTINVEEKLANVEIDSIQIQQVFINLIRNSLDELEKLPEECLKNIWIGASAQSGKECIRFFVRDNGPGIPAEKTDFIFQAFASGKEESMGIGLAICQSILKDHDSFLDFIPLEVGVEFYFNLPICI